MFELTLPTMTCGHCVKVVSSTVQRVDAQAALTIDLPTHKVQIESALDRPLFEKALADEGYPAA